MSTYNNPYSQSPPSGTRPRWPRQSPPDRNPAYSWRDEVMSASGLNILAGIWLIIAPFVLAYSGDDPIWNDVVFGAIVLVLAFVRVAGAYRETWLSVINALIGVWIFVSAFWLASSSTASWNDIILGVIVFVLACWSAAASSDGPRTRAPASGASIRHGQ